MGISLKDLRIDIAKSLRACVTGTVDSASSATVTDAELADKGESTQAYTRWWLYIGDEERRVTVFSQNTGTLTVGRAFTQTPSAGAAYELHKLMSVADLNRLINRTLSECWHLDLVPMPVVSGQRQYDLSPYTWLTHEQQLWDVEYRHGDTPNEYRYLPSEWYWVDNDEGKLTLNLRPRSATGIELRLRCVRPYAALNSDSAETDCPPDWVRAGTRFRVYEWLSQDEPNADVARYREQMSLAYADYQAQARAYMPREPMRIQFRDHIRPSVRSQTVAW